MKLLQAIFATIGFCVVLLAFVMSCSAVTMFQTEVTRSVLSPDGKALAQIEVRKGGFGTVWTTRVHLIAGDRQRWTVYQTKDSDFEPPLRWVDGQTLVVGLPCDRFGYVSNPDDWQRADPNDRRLRVRFEYAPECAGL